MNPFQLAASLGALIVAAAPSAAALQERPETPPEAPDEQAEAARLEAEADARWRRLEAETEAAVAARREARERYEQAITDAEAARVQYQADLARHRESLEQSQRQQEEYERRLREYRDDPAVARRAEPRREREERPAAAAGAAAPASCEEQSQRNRRRGRMFGRLVGVAAAGLGARPDGIGGAVATLLPVAELLGEAIAGLLDCEEQQKAAAATEEAVRGGVGTTAAWESDSRPGVTGSSTVTAVETEAGGGECMTVTDIVIVDGEETRAPKRMCRRPPSNRFVRV